MDPWRRYPFDLGHNFVLAHKGCNNRKGERLAAVGHLRRAGRCGWKRDALLRLEGEWEGVPAVVY